MAGREDKYAAPLNDPVKAQRAVAVATELQKLKKIDLNEPKAIRKRVDFYFDMLGKYQSRGTVSGLAFSLGIDRRVLYEITRGLVTSNKATHIPQECKDIIIDAYQLLEVMWEENFTSGSIHPVAGIFIAKNSYGYRDQTELVVEPKNVLGETQDQEELEKRLLASVVTDI